ncbi:MAG: YggT family protein [Proteobacteria bacterium]|nr:YggT family protein [Pseudomonadota bacterium]
MDVVLVPLLGFAVKLIDLYIWVVIICVVLSWLVAFSVVNMSNRIVYLIGDFVNRLTEPALRLIRQWLPKLGGLDISPIILILGLWMLQEILTRLAFRLA